MAELIVCSCVEEPGTKFIDNLPEFAEAMHVHDDSDNFRNDSQYREPIRKQNSSEYDCT